MKNMAEHRDRHLKQRTIGIFDRYTENYAYLRSRKQGFFEMAEAKSTRFRYVFTTGLTLKKATDR